MFFALLTFFFFARPYFTAKRETFQVSLLFFPHFRLLKTIIAIYYYIVSNSITSASRSTP